MPKNNWYTKNEIENLLNEEMKLIIDILKKQDVRIIKGRPMDHWQPFPVLFTNKPFKITNELRQLAEKRENIHFGTETGSFIGSKANNIIPEAMWYGIEYKKNILGFWQKWF